MTFKRLSSYLEKLEKTASRNEMTAILAELFKEAKAGEIDKICYLSLGRLAPKYEGIEFNIAEKMMIKILARAYEKETSGVRKLYKKVGDLGEVAGRFATQRVKKKTEAQKISVNEVFGRLYEIAITSGEGSVERKIDLFTKLLLQLSPLSAKYVVRIPIGKLRLGFSDMTILDALSWMKTGDKTLRPELERAYNISADIGRIAKVFKEKGLKGIKKIEASVGTPIRTAQAERLPTAEKIIEKLGKCASEKKMDGFRVEIHIDTTRKMRESGVQLDFEDFDTSGPWVAIFSRNLENITHMFPDIVEAAQKLKVRKAVLDGEAIAYNPDTGEFLPFQETVQRKRKYGIAEKARKIPLKVFAFDLLYLDGKSLISEPFSKRRKLLKKVLGKVRDTIQLAYQKIISTPAEIHREFDLSISEGLEGLVVKKLDSVYQAGARNFNWVKYKRTTEGELADTIDCVVMGYYRGRGKRAGFGIGAFLTGVYDEASDQFMTIAKIGTGLTDEQWGEMKKRCDGVKALDKPARFVMDKNLDPDVWCEPAIVVEIKADEITKSPVHTAAKDSDALGLGGPGLALRFPRLVDFRDKDPEQATTVEEVLRLYGMARKARP
jgi:DNA ligase-1